MAPIERSAVAIATPEVIWKACFEHMKFELWDPDVTELIDVSGGCDNGTTFKFVMKDGSGPIPMVLSNIDKDKSLTFSGVFMGAKVEGTVILTPLESDKTKIDYTFDIGGLLGLFAKTFKRKAVVGGTELGLANMVRLAEDEQQK